MAWLLLIFAGMCEVVGASSMNKLSKGKNWPAFTTLILAFSFSFFSLSQSMKTIPMGTAYAVWTGIGTVGTTLVGMFVYGESKSWKRILCIGMVLLSVIGLKLLS
jgi:paired small multidrug resistance pump